MEFCDLQYFDHDGSGSITTEEADAFIDYLRQYNLVSNNLSKHDIIKSLDAKYGHSMCCVWDPFLVKANSLKKILHCSGDGHIQFYEYVLWLEHIGSLPKRISTIGA
jgi:hypothetical protein